jgi:ATP-binding cassette subfamily C exporter for protease/lipase
VVLDEPNSNLDEAGEAALMNTLESLRAQGASVLVITHRTSVLPQANKLLMLREGQVVMFGPRDEVLAALQKAQAEQQGLPAPAPATEAARSAPARTPTYTTAPVPSLATMAQARSTPKTGGQS